MRYVTSNSALSLNASVSKPSEPPSVRRRFGNAICSIYFDESSGLGRDWLDDLVASKLTDTPMKKLRLTESPPLARRVFMVDDHDVVAVVKQQSSAAGCSYFGNDERRYGLDVGVFSN